MFFKGKRKLTNEAIVLLEITFLLWGRGEGGEELFTSFLEAVKRLI
jgi:hypothetical protein